MFFCFRVVNLNSFIVLRAAVNQAALVMVRYESCPDLSVSQCLKLKVWSLFHWGEANGLFDFVDSAG